MWKYLRAAFFLRLPVPGLGRVPLNVVALAAMGILGLAHPGFWLLGVGLETAYLATIASSARFQRLVRGQELHALDDAATDKRHALVKKLLPADQARLDVLDSKGAKALAAYQEAEADAYVLESNREAMNRLSWIYLKLLLARRNLSEMHEPRKLDELREQIKSIEGDLHYDKTSPSVRESKQATLQILKRRLTNFDHRNETLAEVDSDLVRIEAQVDLAVESASMQDRPRTITANIDLVTQLLDTGIYGESESDVADLDRAYTAPPPPISIRQSQSESA